MADIIKVDTARVVATADNIARYNDQIRDNFANVESAIKSLDSAWSSSAATQAIGSFYDIKNAYYQVRFDVVQNYVLFLRNQINEGYTKVETVNNSLADLFK